MKGVEYRKHCKSVPYRSYIDLPGEGRIELGTFELQSEAELARRQAEREYDYYDIEGKTPEEIILNCFTYSQGVLLRVKWYNRHRIGDIVGTLSPKGYYVCRILGRDYRRSHIVWFLHYGEWPEDCLDHENRIRDCDLIGNLRSVTPDENNKNKGLCITNKLGIPGVHKRGNVYEVKISNTYLGRTDDFFEACCRRKSAELKYNFHPTNGR